MNLLEMQTYISYLVDDLAFGYFTQSQLTVFINQSARETQKRLIQAGNNWYLKNTPDTSNLLVANQAEYDPPSDFLKINRLEVVTNPGINETRNILNSITLNQQDYFSGVASSPASFYLSKSKIVLVPTPDAGSAGKTLRIFYTYRIADVSSPTDIVDVPEEFHEYVCHLAAIKCFVKDGRDASLLLRYTDLIEKNLDKDAVERNQDHATQVVITNDDWFGLPY